MEPVVLGTVLIRIDIVMIIANVLPVTVYRIASAAFVQLWQCGTQKRILDLHSMRYAMAFAALPEYDWR